MLPTDRLESGPIPSEFLQLDWLEPKLRGFSCPTEPFDEKFFAFVAVENARNVSDRFLRRHRGTISAHSHGLVEYIERWLAADLPPAESAWDPVYGEAYRAQSLSDPDEIMAVAIALGLRLATCSLPGTWQAGLSRARAFRLNGQMLPEFDRIVVRADTDLADLELGSGGFARVISVARAGREWIAREVAPPSLVGVAARNILLLNQACVSTLKDHGELANSALPAIGEEEPKTVQNALELIARYAPGYLRWVERAVRHIFLLEPTGAKVSSGSVESYLGLIHLSASEAALALAELLVHEGSHQYFHALLKLGPVDDGSDARVFWSPPVKTYRKVDRMAVAYHAFGNILLFYRECMSNRIGERDYCEGRMASLLEDLEQLESPLRGNPALTVVGRSLCVPLMRQLALQAQ